MKNPAVLLCPETLYFSPVREPEPHAEFSSQSFSNLPSVFNAELAGFHAVKKDLRSPAQAPGG